MSNIKTEAPNPVNWLKRILWLGIILFIVSVVILFLNLYPPNRTVDYRDEVQHFKYGSIGTDIENGIPVRVLSILPRMFPEYLPVGTKAKDYSAFGMIQEEDHALPIGFSVRRRFIDLAGPNCAICHVGSVRTSKEVDPKIILGMPANTMDFLSFSNFLFDCAGDWRFTPDYLIPEMEKDSPLNAIDKLIYPLVIPILQGRLLARQAKFAFLNEPKHPDFGPGRVDTFNTFKFDQFAPSYQEVEIPESELIGTVDLPAIWNQRSKEGLWLHWDGNNDSVRERNFSAALAAGATPDNIDIDRLYRVEAWLKDLPAPNFPFSIDPDQAKQGQKIFERLCAGCHSFDGFKVGRVTPIDDIGTDRHRLDSYTETLRAAQKVYTAGYPWAFTHFRKTDGYANMPLDGIWARAPYLHNGSVPTLKDLLTPADKRPKQFYIGDDVYLPDEAGFRHDVSKTNNRNLFRLETQMPGNSNQGHTGERYGTSLPEADKAALIEYLKTL